MKQDSGRLILISGLPGSGKTTCGRWLSDKYKIPYVDYDEGHTMNFVLSGANAVMKPFGM